MLNEIVQIPAGKLVSPRTIENGRLKMTDAGNWTSGFFPGMLWYLYEFTGDDRWKIESQRFTNYLKGQQYNKGTHDLGFMIYGSFGHGYKLTNDSS